MIRSMTQVLYGMTALTLVALAFLYVDACSATATPNLGNVEQPEFLARLKANDLVNAGPDCRVYSDFHAYSPGGKPFRQKEDPIAGPYWVDARGRAVAGLDRVNCDFISFRSRTLIVAAWKG